VTPRSSGRRTIAHPQSRREPARGDAAESAARGRVDEAAGKPGERSISASVGTLNEGHLHASLRARYVEPGDQVEAPVDGYIVDVLRGELLIEVQTANFSAIARKMRDLVTRHRVRLVYPVARDLWIVKLPQAADGAVMRRKSPKHRTAIDLFDELVSFPELMAHPNFQLDVVVTEEEAIWRYDSPRRWRRRGWITVERRLLGVHETVRLRDAGDYLRMIPGACPAEFLTLDLAEALSCARPLAQKVAYCLRKSGLIEKVGSRGNAIVYAKTPPAGPDSIAAAANAVTTDDRN